MTSSQPDLIELELSDGARLQARCFGRFVLLRDKAESNRELTAVGRAIFEQAFTFVDEVIATEVEICLAVNRQFEPESLREVEQLQLEKNANQASNQRELRILIDQQHGDWDAIEQHTGLSRTEYVKRLLDCRLSVAMTGFIPGFIYIKGLPDELHVPRKSNPATRTLPGTFAIGGKYAGVYSLPSAAGWNCIGRIAEQIFCKTSLPPVTISPGDSVKLRQIDQEEFDRLKVDSDQQQERKSASATDDSDGVLRFEHPGTLSLVQDQGRAGLAWYAIPQSGPMDSTAAELANAILGNAKTLPVIECHFAAPRIRFLSDATICLTGADVGWTVDGSEVKANRTVKVSAGSLLAGGGAIDRCRAYIAIHGQIETSRTFGSAATHVSAKFGGNDGQAFVAGDQLSWQKPIKPAFPVRIKFDRTSSDSTLRLQRGPEFEFMNAASQKAIFTDSFSVSRHSDRMGARLDGPTLSTDRKQLADSVPLLTGMVQLTPKGQLIVVLQDGQTTGGYPRVGYLDAKAVELLNQTKNGHPINFRMAE